MSTRLESAARRRNTAAQELDAARDELHAAILADLANGARQVDIVRATGYTREQIRRIARSADSNQADELPGSAS